MSPATAAPSRDARLAAFPSGQSRRAPASDGMAVTSRSAGRSPVAIRARHLDPESRAWLEALDSEGPRRDEAIERLYALLLRETRFEVRRRTAFMAHPSGGDLDDLAVQAAGDAVVAILAKLGQFRGDSLFTTWARRFAQREAPAKIRRRLGRNRDLPMNLEFERSLIWHHAGESPHERTAARQTTRMLAHLIANELTARQREVLIALVFDGVATEELATRLETTTGAIYKTLHDARRKLKANLGEDLTTNAQTGAGVRAQSWAAAVHA
jgi:RNA polymerase sigma-70 factor, ECF subfamily